MTTRMSPIDLRPFKSKADHEREQSLEAQYRGLGNPELVAALEVLKREKNDGPVARG